MFGFPLVGRPSLDFYDYVIVLEVGIVISFLTFPYIGTFYSRPFYWYVFFITKNNEGEFPTTRAPDSLISARFATTTFFVITP